MLLHIYTVAEKIPMSTVLFQVPMQIPIVLLEVPVPVASTTRLLFALKWYMLLSYCTICAMLS